MKREHEGARERTISPCCPSVRVLQYGSRFLGVVVAVGFMFPLAASSAETVSFAPAVNFATGEGPQAVAVGDLTQDGKPDLIVVNGSGNSVSILCGNGTGSFGAPTHFAVGAGPVAVAIGDLNGDGKLDVAVANADSHNVSVLLGTGGGALGPAANFPVGSRPYSVAIGDLNQDGKPDLAAANFVSNTVSILLGDGTGSFGTATDFAAGNGSEVVAIGDLNLDGKPDLAVANFYSNTVSILLGDGTGSFGAATEFWAGEAATFVAIGDLNLDGKPDLAVASAYASDVSVLLGDGSGFFSPALAVPVHGGAQTVEIADFNGDGKPDLAVAYTLAGVVSALIGDGTGAFGPMVDFTGGSGPSYWDLLAAGDLNRDGKPDLAVVNSGSNTVSVLLNTTVPDPAPDLVVQSVSAVISGGDVVVTDVVRNQGTGAAGAFAASYYFAQDPNAPANGTLIGSRSVSGLAANGGYNGATTRFRVPNATPRGTYYVCAVADSGNAVTESNENNNVLCTTGQYTIGPDLTPTSLSASIAGASIYVSDVEQNIGNRWANPFEVSFYFTSSPDASTSGTFIGTRSVPGIDGGSRINSANTRFAIPDTTPMGTYYVCAVSDSGGAVDELNEANNTRCTTGTYLIGPDLVVYALSVTKSGASLYVSDTEQNIGNRRAEAFTVAFYVSLDSAFDQSDTLLGTRAVAGLAGGGASNSRTTVFRVPSGIPAGNYYVIAVTDSGGAVNELNEANDVRATSATYALP
ncbi:MAG: FG-GAP-like repeat-containing protein [Nitrospirota bacterium]